MTPALLMGAVSVVLWVGIALIAWRNSPRARAAMPGGPGRVLVAMLLLLAPWLLSLSAINIGHKLLEASLGDSMLGYLAVSGPLLIVWLALILVVPVSRDAVRNYVRLHSRLASDPPSTRT